MRSNSKNEVNVGSSLELQTHQEQKNPLETVTVQANDASMTFCSVTV